MASRLLSLLAFLNSDDIYVPLFYELLGSNTGIHNDLNRSSPQWQRFLSPQSPLDMHNLESAFAVLQTYALLHLFFYHSTMPLSCKRVLFNGSKAPNQSSHATQCR